MLQRVISFERWRVSHSTSQTATHTFEGAAVLILCVVGFALRLGVALKTSWLYDEIVYVQWLGQWFSAHGLAYIFQIRHATYPPMSPYFANPPLPMLLYGLAIDAFRPFGIPDLLAARLVNVLFGTALIVLVYRLASIWLGPAGRLTATFCAATFPVLVALAGSSYQETIAAFFGLWAVLVFVRSVSQPKRRKLAYLLPIILALALLSKLTNLYLYAGAGAASFYLALRHRLPWRNFALTTFGTVAVCAILWAGARDPHHIAGVIHYVTAARPADHLAPVYPAAEKPVYYVLMMIGTMPLPMAVFVSGGILLLVGQAVFQRRLSPGAIWSVATLAVLATLPYLVGMSTRHEIALPACAFAIIAGFSADELWRRFSHRPFLWSVTAAVLVLGAFTVFLMPMGLLNTYNNALVGGMASDAIYSSGDGAGLDIVGHWLNAHTPKNSTISSTTSYALAQYLNGGRKVLPVFTNSSAAATEGTVFLVVPHPYLSAKDTVLAQTAQSYPVVTQLPSARYPLYTVYAVKNAQSELDDPRTFRAITFKAHPATVRPAMPLSYHGVVLKGGVVAFVSEPHAAEGNSIAVTYRRNRGTNIYVDVMDESGSRYMRGVVPPDAPDSGTYVIPYERMESVSERASDIVTIDTFHTPVRLRLSVDSQGLDERRIDVSIARAPSIMIVPARNVEALKLAPSLFIGRASSQAQVHTSEDAGALAVHLDLTLARWATLTKKTDLRNFADVALSFRSPASADVALYVDEIGFTSSGHSVFERRYTLTAKTKPDGRLFFTFPRSRESLRNVSLRLGFGTHETAIHDSFVLKRVQLVN